MPSRGGSWAGRWLSTCAPSSSLTPSTWPSASGNQHPAWSVTPTRLPVHLIRRRPPPGRLRTRRLDGDRRGRTRQRRRRELLRHPGMRAPRPIPLANQIRTADGDLRLHRSLLQPPTPPLDPRLPPTRRLRAPPRITSTRGLTTVSTETGQLHSSADWSRATVRCVLSREPLVWSR